MTETVRAMTSALNCIALQKNYGGVLAVADVSFAVGPGEILGIIGPNGSGKTTLLNLVSGITSADAGSVWIGQRDVSSKPTHERAKLGLGRTFQNLRLFRNLSVLDNLLIGGHSGPWFSAGPIIRFPARNAENRLRDRAWELLQELQLTEYARRLAGALAYGLQRRVEIARSLMGGPKVLLLDEPVAGMNDIEAHAIIEVLSAVKAHNVAQVVIDHNVAFITRLADRVMVMDAGAVLISGSPAEVVRDERVIRAYLG